MALVEAIPTIVIELAKATPKVVTTVVKTLWDNRGKILEAGKKVLLNIRDGIVDNLSQLMTKVKEIPGKVKGWIEEGLSKLKEVGDNFVKGIWQGISDGLGWIKGKLKEWVGSVVDFCKKILGIKSPSKVMADSVGKYMGEGVGVGFVDAMEDVEKEMAAAIPIDSLIQEVDGAMSGLSHGIKTSINPQVNPNITYEQNYNLMAAAIKEALNGTEVTLDDREVGKIVTKTITEEIYGG
jgi:phage-related protein